MSRYETISELYRDYNPLFTGIIVDNSLPRSKWAMMQILETFPNKSGLIRSVLVKTQKSVLTRPIVLFCLRFCNTCFNY